MKAVIENIDLITSIIASFMSIGTFISTVFSISDGNKKGFKSPAVIGAFVAAMVLVIIASILLSNENHVMDTSFINEKTEAEAGLSSWSSVIGWKASGSSQAGGAASANQQRMFDYFLAVIVTIQMVLFFCIYRYPGDKGNILPVKANALLLLFICISGTQFLILRHPVFRFVHIILLLFILNLSVKAYKSYRKYIRTLENRSLRTPYKITLVIINVIIAVPVVVSIVFNITYFIWVSKFIFLIHIFLCMILALMARAFDGKYDGLFLSGIAANISLLGGSAFFLSKFLF